MTYVLDFGTYSQNVLSAETLDGLLKKIEQESGEGKKLGRLMFDAHLFNARTTRIKKGEVIYAILEKGEWVFIPPEIRAPGHIVLLRAVATLNSAGVPAVLGTLDDYYKEAGYGGWGTMATNTQLRRLTGDLYRREVTYFPEKGFWEGKPKEQRKYYDNIPYHDPDHEYLARHKATHPTTGHQTWHYTITEKGQQKLDAYNTDNS